MERWKFVCYAGLAVFLSPLRNIRRAKVKPERILVIPIMTRVGDLVCATAAFRAIKLTYPNAHLSVLVGKKVIDLIRSSERIDEIINLNDIPFKGFWGRGRFFRYIFSKHFDAVVSLTNNPFNNLVALYSFAPLRIKTVVSFRSRAERVTDWFNNRPLEYKTGEFLQDHYIRLLSLLNIPFTPPVKEVFVTNTGEKRADEFLREHGLAQASLIIGMSMSAGHTTKEWPREYFAELVTGLVETKGARVIFIDSPSNRPRIEEMLKAVSAKVRSSVTIATTFTLAELPSIIKRFHMFISVDTGPIYIAHALKVPVIDIIGPVHPHDQPPEDERSVQVAPPKEFPPVFFVLGSPKPGSFEKARKAVYACTVAMVMVAFDELCRRGAVKLSK
jgi:ADP-heptose:LPS heptosyltransferase